MTLRTFSHSRIDARCRHRPSGYREQLMQAAIKQDTSGVTFDTTHPAWQKLKQQYALPRPLQSTGGRILSWSKAVLTGRYVSRAIMIERMATCRACDQVRSDQAGHWCGMCGCRVGREAKRIVNLAAYEENLPHWGCKHPRRAQGAGWKR